MYERQDDKLTVPSTLFSEQDDRRDSRDALRPDVFPDIEILTVWEHPTSQTVLSGLRREPASDSRVQKPFRWREIGVFDLILDLVVRKTRVYDNTVFLY